MPGYTKQLQELFSLRQQFADIHPFLARLFPVAVVEEEMFHVYDHDGREYQLAARLPLPIPVPEGVRAAFPLEGYEDRVVCVVTGEVFDTPAGYVTIFHEFVHCGQFEGCEPALKVSLAIARRAKAAGDFMWEIDHPFPYADPAFVEAYTALLAALREDDSGGVQAARRRLRRYLSPVDYEYMVWQEWKEGLARFLENKMQRRLGLPVNHGGAQLPYDRVVFYEGGARLIRFLEKEEPEVSRDGERLFKQMMSDERN